VERVSIRPENALLAMAAAVFVFHHVPSLAGDTAGDWIDLLTPFAVIGTAAAAVASLGTPPAAVALALTAGILYVDGHGIHLAANSIGHESLTGDAEDVTHFWDEVFGHIEWHLGLMALFAAVCLAEARSGTVRGSRPGSGRTGAATAALLGFALFTSTVEGGTWWLELAATGVFVLWAAPAPRPLVVTSTCGFALAALLIAVWAIWHGGVPQFSEVGWL
jgi:hypothetical protein